MPPPALQQGEDGDGIPAVQHRLPVQSPSQPRSTKGTKFGLNIYILLWQSCSTHGPLLCFAFRRAAPGRQSPGQSRNPSNADYAVSSSLPPKGQVSI